MSRPAINISDLDVEEKLELIEDLWESLASDPTSVPVTEAQKKMLDDRIAEMDAGEVDSIPWEDVKARISKEVL